MKKLIDHVDLLNIRTGKFEQASLFEGVDAQSFSDFRSAWVPAFDARLPASAPLEAYVQANMLDVNWDWEELAAVADDPLYRLFTVECRGQTQGFMRVSLMNECRIPGNKGKALVYIDRLATAPWNRPRFTNSPLYRGVGTLMVSTAISMSLDEDDAGFGGRIGLHSVRTAEGFYRDECGMTDLGIDPKYGARYFEMDEAQALRFLTGASQ